MNLPRTSRWRVPLTTTATALLVGAWGARAQSVTQSITLNPGWNSIHVEVEPANQAPGVVFTNLPVSSVWARFESLSSVEFIQDQNEVRAGQPGWLAWFAPSRPEAFLGNLFAIKANRAYLVRYEGAAPAVLSLTGRPSFRQPVWVPDAYNLKGFALDPTAPPTFHDYFRPSAAHFNRSLDRLHGVFRLNASGQWTAVGPADTMKSGEAYWVYAQGASDYNGPLGLRLEVGDALEFGTALERLTLSLRNRSTHALTAHVRDLSNPAAPALAYQRFDEANGFAYDPLPAPLSLATAAGETKRLTLAIRRIAFSAPAYRGILEVTDDAGSRHLIPVTAERVTAAAGRFASQGRQDALGRYAKSDALAYAGLWAGSVAIRAVSEANSGVITTNPATQEVTRTGGSTNPTPVKAEFSFRLLLHVDDAGNARLLKEVIQMFQEGTYTNDAQGNLVAATPGRYVLLTDDRLISQFQGASLRDGVPVGRRLSTAALDFNRGPTNHLELTGTFAIGNQLTVSVTNAPTDPTNPYRHKFHPDHDNLDLRFASYTPEAFAITRQITLGFAASDPLGGTSPNFGYSVMGGTYGESLAGLHKVPIHVQGVFRLERVSDIAVLNQ